MRKNIFNSRYQGPSGPHLSCLTETSMFGSYTENQQRTIHSSSGPKSTRGRRRDEGRICAPRNSSRQGYLAKASEELDRRRRDHAQTKIYIDNKSGMVWKEGMYKVPGSMNIG